MGFTGATIKDTWTKLRGRVEVGEGGGFSWGEVEGWGENADNCNRITMKTKKKKEPMQLKPVRVGPDTSSLTYLLMILFGFFTFLDAVSYL